LCADIRTDPRSEGKGESRPQRPPVAKAAQVTAVRGVPVEIRLTGLTASTRQLQFIVRRNPGQGRLLGQPVPAGKDTAIVRYEADPGSTAATDTFSFAVKVEGSSSSEEAEVTVRLVDPAPVLEAPPGMDLGRMLANEPQERTFTIRNKGNAPYKAAVPLPEGWAWIAPSNGEFEIGPGASVEATLRVRMREAGELDQKVTLLPGTVIRFIGRALPPFLGYPALLRLQWEPGTAKRTWHFSLRNNRPDPLTIGLSAPTGLTIPGTVTVPFAETQEVTVTATGDVSKVWTGKIRMESPGWSQEINFEAPAAPAWVELNGSSQEAALDFGVLPPGEEAKTSREVVLRNIGGTPSLVRWDPLRFFTLEGMETETVLAPQTERKLTLRPRPEEPGRLKEELIFRMTGGDRTLRLLAEVDPKAGQEAMMSGHVLDVRPPAPEGSPGPRPATTEAGQRLRVQVLSRGLMKSFPKTDRTLPTVEGVNLQVIEPERIVFDWPAPGPGTWTYHVMVRMLRNHGLQQAPIPEYDEMDNVKVTNSPTGGRAEVSKLHAEPRWIGAIVAVREDGVATKAGPDLTFITPPVPENRWPWRFLGVLGVVAVGLYVRQKWREDVKWKD